MQAFRRVTLSRLATIVALLAVVVFTAAASARAETKLRWKFKAGDKVGYEMGMEMDQDMKIGDMSVGMKMTHRMDMSWDVKDVAADGTATISQTVNRVRMDMTLPPGAGAGPIKYDSKAEKQEPGAEMIAPMFDAMVGKPFTMKVTTLGEVKEVQLPKAMIEAMSKTPLGAMNPMFSEDGIKQMFKQNVLPLPEKAVADGTTWDSTMEMKGLPFGKMVSETHYKYAGQEERGGKKLDKIDVSANTKFEKAPNAEIQLDIKNQESAGAIYFDNKAGTAVESSQTSKMSMEVEFGGMTIEQDVTTKTTLKRVDPSKSAREL
ncbi:MAG: hypothetical protein HYX69_09350 [Planctomycetia bacterium]|nr:hypothetical protein [Planctomycetia bacterium]